MLCFAKDKVHFQIQMIAESSTTVLLPMEKKLTITHAHLIDHFSMQLYNLVSTLQVRVLLDLILKFSRSRQNFDIPAAVEQTFSSKVFLKLRTDEYKCSTPFVYSGQLSRNRYLCWDGQLRNGHLCPGWPMLRTIQDW